MSTSLTIVLFFVFVAMGLALLGSLVFIRKREKKRGDGLYFESSQGPLFYKQWGRSGPRLLFIHGLGCSSYTWRKVASTMAANHRVLSIDLWGFGYSSKKMTTTMGLDSQAELIEEFLSALNIDRIHIVGHSMGGQLALWLAMTNRRVDKCIAVTPAAHPSLVADWLTQFTWIANWTPLVLSRNAIRRLLLRLVRDDSFVTEEMVNSYYRPYKDPDAHISFASSLEIIRDPRVFENLPQLQSETLAIWAANDTVIQNKVTKTIQKQMPQARHITHPQAGHLPMEDDPVWMIAQIESFIK